MEQMVAMKHSARSVRREFVLPALALDIGVHGSPLHAPPLQGEERAHSRLSIWIVVNAAVV